MDTFEIVKSIIKEKFLYLDDSAITKDADLSHDLGADSVDIQEILMSVENEFNVAFGYDQADKLRTPGQILEAIG